MKKFLFLLVAAALLLSVVGPVYAEYPASENVVDLFKGGGSSGTTPPTEVIRVRYARGGANDAALASGDIVVWDENSYDGYTISGCIVDNAQSFAGVLVTSIATSDGIGYMAVRGLAMAKVDTSSATAGRRLVTSGNTLYLSLGTQNNITPKAEDQLMTNDVGVLLRDTAADGLMPIWLD